MYKLCKTEESAKRQREVEEVLLGLMLEKHYELITVSEICLIANMPRKTFYRYFDGKEDVLQALLHHTFTDSSNFKILKQRKRSEVKISEEFEELFTFWKSKKSIFEAFDKSGLTGFLVESTTTFAMQDFKNIEQYLSDSGIEEKRIAFQFVICGLLTMTINWYRSGFAESIPNLARTATKIITRPLFENLTRTE